MALQVMVRTQAKYGITHNTHWEHLPLLFSPMEAARRKRDTDVTEHNSLNILQLMSSEEELNINFNPIHASEATSEAPLRSTQLPPIFCQSIAVVEKSIEYHWIHDASRMIFHI